jgi:opacity protein-like surface antigen
LRTRWAISFLRQPQCVARQALPRKFTILGALLALICFIPGLRASAESNPSQVESEIGTVGGGSIGNLHIFGFASDRRLEMFGAQYVRHSWGGLLTARVDYLTEVLPVVLLREPKVYGANGMPLTAQRKTVYGAGISPIGVRLLWRRNKAWRPYLMGEGGTLYFKDRVLSTQGTHLNFSGETGAGIEFRTSPQTHLRLGYSWFHFSNGDIAARNPGLDSNFIYAVFSFDLDR